MVRRVTSYLNLPHDVTANILHTLWRIFREYNFILLEINPLALTSDGVLALDRKGIIDDDSLSDKRLVNVVERYYSELDSLGRTAIEKGFAAVKLEGNIAVIGNGAGLTMATVDAVNNGGGRVGIFLDLGGGAERERVKEALKLVLSQENIDKVLINILGGITRCDEVAQGVVEAIQEHGNKDVKIVIRLSGFMEEKGRKILQNIGIKPYDTLEEAIMEVVR